MYYLKQICVCLTDELISPSWRSSNFSDAIAIVPRTCLIRRYLLLAVHAQSCSVLSSLHIVVAKRSAIVSCLVLVCSVYLYYTQCNPVRFFPVSSSLRTLSKRLKSKVIKKVNFHNQKMNNSIKSFLEGCNLDHLYPIFTGKYLLKIF